MHLAEPTNHVSADEREWRRSSGGLGYVAFPRRDEPVLRRRLGVLHPGSSPRTAFRDAADREAWRAAGHVVLCPRSNRNLGLGRADVPALLAAGVRLALGTDSLASVESLDVLDDAVGLRRSFPDLDPAAIARAATLGGAQALGLDDLGTIAPGKRAALAFAAGAVSDADPHGFLLSGEARLRAVEGQ
jgi:cytosine/adenosine deaminase-related metal-dependent hydrolase